MGVVIDTSIRVIGDRVISGIARRTSTIVVPGLPRMGIDPGLVIRALSEQDGQWVITTIGCGNGRLATINRLTADYVWGENARRIGRESIYEEARANSRHR